MKREAHHAAGVVLFRPEPEGRAYLLLHSALTKRPVWEFPKGGIEEGESEREAAERELREETGLAKADYSLREGWREEEQYRFSIGKGQSRSLVSKRVVYFLAEAYSIKIRISREATDFRWLSSAEAKRLLRFAEKRRVLDHAERWLDGGGADA